jgi:cystathionine beta-lyase/cystathionine gamma-synthase
MGSLTLNDKELYDKLFFLSCNLGGCPSPFDCFLALRGLKTLKIRMDASCKNALKIAEFL